MKTLDRLFALDLLPPDTLPLTDEYDGVVSIYGLMIVMRDDEQMRADVLEYPDRWKIGETELPLGMCMPREWHYAKRDVTLKQVIEYARAWGCDPNTSPTGWFRELVIGRAERWGAHYAADHLKRKGRYQDPRLSISPSCFIPLQLPPADQKQDDCRDEGV